MKIKEIISQYRRDFYAIYECQFCGHETGKESGYDDHHFHTVAIPKMVCDKCGKSVEKNGDKLKGEYRALTTRYPEGYQV